MEALSLRTGVDVRESETPDVLGNCIINVPVYTDIHIPDNIRECLAQLSHLIGQTLDAYGGQNSLDFRNDSQAIIKFINRIKNIIRNLSLSAHVNSSLTIETQLDYLNQKIEDQEQIIRNLKQAVTHLKSKVFGEKSAADRRLRQISELTRELRKNLLQILQKPAKVVVWQTLSSFRAQFSRLSSMEEASIVIDHEIRSTSKTCESVEPEIISTNFCLLAEACHEIGIATSPSELMALLGGNLL